MKNWELSFGFYPGIMMGFRTYKEVKKLYKYQFNKASKIVEKMLQETSYGENYQKVVEWNNKLLNKLNINNFLLISKDY